MRIGRQLHIAVKHVYPDGGLERTIDGLFRVGLSLDLQYGQTLRDADGKGNNKVEYDRDVQDREDLIT